MNSSEFQYMPTPPAPTKEEIEFEAEKKDLRSRCNSVGLMTILATVIFMAFSVIVVFAYYLFLGNNTLPANFDSIPDNILGGLANVAAIGLCGALFIKMRKENASDVLIFQKISTKKLLGLITIGFTVSMLSNYLTNIFLNTAYSLGFDLNLEIETPVSNSALEIFLYFLSVAVVPAFSEEILFRGILLSTLRKHGDGFAVFVSSFLFGLFHGNFVQFPFAFVIGLVLGWTVVYSNSMLPAIFIHFANNAFSVTSDVLYTNAESWGINTDVIDILTLILVAVIAVLAIIATVIIAKRDKSFLKLKGDKGILDRQTKTKMLVTSPTVIIAVILLLVETVSNHLAL